MPRFDVDATPGLQDPVTSHDQETDGLHGDLLALGARSFAGTFGGPEGLRVQHNTPRQFATSCEGKL